MARDTGDAEALYAMFAEIGWVVEFHLLRHDKHGGHTRRLRVYFVAISLHRCNLTVGECKQCLNDIWALVQKLECSSSGTYRYFLVGDKNKWLEAEFERKVKCLKQEPRRVDTEWQEQAAIDA